MFNFGFFVNDHYMPCFKAMYNSIKYYMGEKVHVIVYNYDTISEENKKRINALGNCEIIEVPNEIKRMKNYMVGCAWRPIILRMMPSIHKTILFMDVDMVLLDDVSDIFSIIESGDFVGSNEWTYDIKNQKQNQRIELDKFNDDLLSITKVKYSKDIPVYNGGLLGLNMDVHRDLVVRWGDAFQYFDNPNGLTNDQFVLSFLMSIEDTKITKLDTKYYMNTWHNHNTPRKLVGFDNGKLCLYNANNVKDKIRIYHYTGDIGMKDRETFITWRYFHYSGETPKHCVEYKRQTPQALKEMSRDLWEVHHNSPGLMINQYFYERYQW
jgi:hypothetical protein